MTAALSDVRPRRLVAIARSSAVVVVLAILFVGVAVPRPAMAADLPSLTAPVNDFAHIIDPQTSAELDRMIRSLQAASGDVVVVATVESIEPYSTIEEYAVKLFENGGRGIGAKGKDNGALIVVALKERRARIESGYDLEQFITDGFAGQTIREDMIPAFRQGQYASGILTATRRIVTRIADQRGVPLTDVQPPRQLREERRFPFSLIIFIIVLILLSSRRRRRGPFNRSGGWSGWSSGVGPFGGGFGGGFGGFGGGSSGGGGGGFGGFGGGGSGGGGASGGW